MIEDCLSPLLSRKGIFEPIIMKFLGTVDFVGLTSISHFSSINEGVVGGMYDLINH